MYFQEYSIKTHTHTHTHTHTQNPVLVIIFSLEKLLPWEDTSTKDFWKKEKNNKLTTIPLILKKSVT